MAQKFLNTAKIGAGIKHVRGERVAQDVRCNLFLYAGTAKIFLNHSFNASRGYPRPLPVQEHCLGGMLGVQKVVPSGKIT